MSDVRELLRRPVDLSEYDAIRELCREFEERTGVVTVPMVDATVSAELASRAGDVIQLVREALSNVGRHAAAATCRVSLFRDGDGAIVLEIDDDGKGFDAHAPRQGMGLTNLEHRVAAMGGELRTASVPTEGTTVSARWPA